LTINYVIVNFELALASSYIHKYLSPELNQIIFPNSKHRVMDFERWLRQNRRNPLGFFLANIGGFAAEMILILPAILSIGAAHYVLLLPTIPTTPSLWTSQQFVESWLGPLGMIAWGFLILALVTIIGCIVYWMISGFMANQ
jgi:C4-dicarboxylate transporter